MMGSNLSKQVDFDEGKFNIACRIVDQMRDGLLTVTLTGQGEPLLFTKQIEKYLDCINFRFPKIELQTNGILVEENIKNLKRWRDNGLTLVCLSVAANDPEVSNGIMGIRGDRYNYWRTATMLQEIGLNVRLNCTMTKVGVWRPEDAENLIFRADNAGILQTTFREVDMPNPCHDAKIGAWVSLQKPEGAAKRLHHYLRMNGAVPLLELPHGGTVYSYHNQNVCISNCLGESTNPDDIRRLIFFPDGRLSYNWQYPAARLL
jgi:molybdenum cofactor biosynthesis enzyme MoaA